LVPEFYTAEYGVDNSKPAKSLARLRIEELAD
jgi:hypothetical protein